MMDLKIFIHFAQLEQLFVVACQPMRNGYPHGETERTAGGGLRHDTIRAARARRIESRRTGGPRGCIGTFRIPTGDSATATVAYGTLGAQQRVRNANGRFGRRGRKDLRGSNSPRIEFREATVDTRAARANQRARFSLDLHSLSIGTLPSQFVRPSCVSLLIICVAASNGAGPSQSQERLSADIRSSRSGLPLRAQSD